MGTFYSAVARFVPKKGADPEKVEEVFKTEIGCDPEAISARMDGDYMVLEVSSEMSYSMASEASEALIHVAEKFANWTKSVLKVYESTDEGEETWIFGPKKKCLEKVEAHFNEMMQLLVERKIKIEIEARDSKVALFRTSLPEVE